MSYHFNPATGKSGVCEATGKRGCPLTKQYADGKAPHFNSKQEADAFGQDLIEAQQKNEGNTEVNTISKSASQYSNGRDNYRKRLMAYEDGVGPVMDIAGTEDWVLVEDRGDGGYNTYNKVYYSPNKKQYFYGSASSGGTKDASSSFRSIDDFYSSSSIENVRNHSGVKDLGKNFDPNKVPPLDPKLISPENERSSEDYFYNRTLNQKQ